MSNMTETEERDVGPFAEEWYEYWTLHSSGVYSQMIRGINQRREDIGVSPITSWGDSFFSDVGSSPPDSMLADVDWGQNTNINPLYMYEVILGEIVERLWILLGVDDPGCKRWYWRDKESLRASLEGLTGVINAPTGSISSYIGDWKSIVDGVQQIISDTRHQKFDGWPISDNGVVRVSGSAPFGSLLTEYAMNDLISSAPHQTTHVHPEPGEEDPNDILTVDFDVFKFPGDSTLLNTTQLKGDDIVPGNITLEHGKTLLCVCQRYTRQVELWASICDQHPGYPGPPTTERVVTMNGSPIPHWPGNQFAWDTNCDGTQDFLSSGVGWIIPQGFMPAYVMTSPPTPQPNLAALYTDKGCGVAGDQEIRNFVNATEIETFLGYSPELIANLTRSLGPDFTWRMTSEAHISNFAKVEVSLNAGSSWSATLPFQMFPGSHTIKGDIEQAPVVDGFDETFDDIDMEISPFNGFGGPVSMTGPNEIELTVGSVTNGTTFLVKHNPKVSGLSSGDSGFAIEQRTNLKDKDGDCSTYSNLVTSKVDRVVQPEFRVKSWRDQEFAPAITWDRPFRYATNDCNQPVFLEWL